MAADTPVVVPHESVNDETVKLLRWLVADGQRVSAGEDVAEVEGSKATFNVPSPRPGVVRLLARVGDEVAVGAALCVVSATDAAPQANGQAHAPPPPPPVRPAAPPPVVESRPVAAQPVLAGPGTQRFSKAALELVQQHRLDPELFRGAALVRARDVLARVAPAAPAHRQPDPPPVAVPEPEPARPAGGVPGPANGPFDEVPLSRQKQTENRYLRQGGAHVIPSQVTILVPTAGLRDALAEDPAGLSATALIVFEVGRLLRRYPDLNAFYTSRTSCRYREVNVGFAVAGEYGLKVPVVRGADTKSAGKVAEDVRELLAAYAGNTLLPEHLSGGTFTVSDLSGEGVFALNPLIVRGQAAILGVGAEVRHGGGATFSLTLSFDHQLADGLQASRFLSDLAARLRHHESTLRRPAAVPTCSRCGRTVREVRRLNGHLLQTVDEAGGVVRVCTSCAAGF
ncbi:MAG: hypothetical protein C0501_27130 [Isosphaera sp.]|nr:hypothetical protein [Isosphaera sp.]